MERHHINHGLFDETMQPRQRGDDRPEYVAWLKETINRLIRLFNRR